MKSFMRMAVKATHWRTFTATAATLLPLACILFLFSSGAQGKDDPGNISVSLKPKQVQLGEEAMLRIQISGEEAEQPALPKVSGLLFFPVGQSSEYRSINGRESSSTSYMFQVLAKKSGEFIIPPIKVAVNGRMQETRPMRLRVVGEGSSNSPSRLPLPPPAMSRQRGGNSATKPGHLGRDEENEPAFLRVIPRKALSYVGEMVPMEIRAYFRQDMQATLKSLPSLKGSAFAFQDPEKEPERTEEIIDGVRYTVLTWYTAVAAVKEGEHRVQAELNAALLIPDRSLRGRFPFGESLFDDDFFNGFFGRTKEENVTLTNPQLKIRVLPLPKSGKPEHFSGAVGHFTLSASANPKSGMVGDPITVTMTVDGVGNFDRVSSPYLDVSSGWKKYTPTTSFNPEDSAGYTGKKTFEQAIIPLDTSMKDIPPIQFSYFDTESEKYVTLKTDPITVDILPGSVYSRAVPNVPGAPGAAASFSSTTNAPKKGSTGMVPIQISLGTVVADITPIIKNPWFLGSQGVPIGMFFFGLFFTQRQKKISADPDMARKKRTRRKVAQWIKEMNRAMNENDVPGFFNACRSASQEKLGEIWSVSPESITLAEIRERLPGETEGIRHVFETADAVAYSGQSFSSEELRKCRDLVIREMEKMSKENFQHNRRTI